MDWRDLRIALAVERHGTLAAAGAALAIDPTTVSRRVAALEGTLGTPVFVRRGEGWVPTEAGRRVLEHAARMAEEVRALRHDVDTAVHRVEGNVRLTTLDEVASAFLVPHVAALRARHPGLTLQLLCTDKVLELTRGRADVALRLVRPTEPGLRVRRLGTVRLGLYASPELAARLTLGPLPSAVPVDLVILGTVEAPLMETAWAFDHLPHARVAVGTSSVTTLLEMVRCGVGVGVLAVASAEAAGLVRLDDGHDAPARELWRAVPETIADAPRIRAVVEWLDELPGA